MQLIPDIKKELGTKDEFERRNFLKEIGGTNELKTYHIYLKSHTHQPDYDDEYEATDKDEAVEHWYKQLCTYGWDRETLLANIEEI